MIIYLCTLRPWSDNIQTPASRISTEKRKRRWIEMTDSATPCINDGRLVIRDRTVLTGVPPNITLEPLVSASAFVGASSATRSSYHEFTLGVLDGFRWLCLYRFKIWWMIPRWGKSTSEIPYETQMLLLEAKENAMVEDETVDSANNSSIFYILILPVLDGDFRASLHGCSTNELQFSLESGDPEVQTSQVLEAIFINSGNNPYELIRESIKILAKQKGTFSHVENKKIPDFLNWFGWSTWDAFYTNVNPEGIKKGLQSLAEGGTPAKFLIIDDGWQETQNEFQKEGQPLTEGTQFAIRLTDVKENCKFKEKDTCKYLGELIKFIKERYGLKYVLMWHALAGYWGGVLPTSEAMKKYDPKLKYPVVSPSMRRNLWDIAMDSLEKYGVGLIGPAKIDEFYNDLHKYLSTSGVDGAKVDVQTLLETLGASHGGRVSLTRKYQQALEESISKNFGDNNLICCMCHNSDSIYSSKKSAVVRASEDFMPKEPGLQTLHVASVSFNSLLLGEIAIPDWDMFHSDHDTANFHAAARAVGGSGVYVSDKPGQHNFEILKRIVLPDGSILRARFAGRPTRDCLFDDPVMDGRSLLKIWNLNKICGVICIFNCQGSGFWPPREQFNQVGVGWPLKDVPVSASSSLCISGHVSPSNIEYLGNLAGENWNGDCAVYAFNSGSLTRISKCGSLAISLYTLQFEVYTISPIKDYNQNIQFAPIGLINMFNSGGAIDDLSSDFDSSGCMIKIKCRGPGQFGAYSSLSPKHCVVGTKEEEFNYDGNNGFLAFNLSHVPAESNFWDIKIMYPII
ncbi:probable galactinol--sucrose galactosyltransferase 2 [Typha angustifolia]|uniref:probable galactinol--sucrose galactosyltransferase 2 n=1 Tax=Typha angustifolia TaxID=59011 RepID=UPI003C2E19CE